MEGKKKCPKCGEEKPATEEFFGKNRAASDGLNYWCKKCKSKYQKEKWEKDHGGKPKKGRNFKAEYKRRKIGEKKNTSSGNQIPDAILLDTQILKAFKKSVANQIVKIIEEAFA